MASESTRILLIDDNPDDRELIREALLSSGEGYTIVEAGSGEEGLEKLGEEGCNLVFLEYSLPRLTGLEGLKCIVGTCNVPVVMITGAGDEDVSVEAMKQSAYD